MAPHERLMVMVNILMTENKRTVENAQRVSLRDFGDNTILRKLRVM